MDYRVLLHQKANSDLRKLDRQMQIQIEKKLKELAKNPKILGEHLKFSEWWRIRVGDYRAIYEIDEKEKRIIVLYIGHRKNVYDDFSKMLF